MLTGRRQESSHRRSSRRVFSRAKVRARAWAFEEGRKRRHVEVQGCARPRRRPSRRPRANNTRRKFQVSERAARNSCPYQHRDTPQIRTAGMMEGDSVRVSVQSTSSTQEIKHITYLHHMYRVHSLQEIVGFSSDRRHLTYGRPAVPLSSNSTGATRCRRSLLEHSSWTSNGHS